MIFVKTALFICKSVILFLGFESCGSKFDVKQEECVVRQLDETIVGK